MFLRSLFHRSLSPLSLTPYTTSSTSINIPISSFPCVIDNMQSINSRRVICQKTRITNDQYSKPVRFCPCGRSHFLETRLISAHPSPPSNASDDSDYKDTLKKVRSPRPDWYEELVAWALNSGMVKAYEAEVATYKSQLFTNLKGNVKEVLEIGVGTGPNLKYYANLDDVQVFGMDPNVKMRKYAQAAAEAAGLPPANFKFIQAVGEVIPLSDASVDAVVGTLVLCSVTHVDQTLQEVKRVLRPGGLYLFVEHVAAKGEELELDSLARENGTFVRFLQNVLGPLHQKIADGCHLTRETGKKISEAGFSAVDLSTTSLSKAGFVNPHVYGIARK